MENLPTFYQKSPQDGYNPNSIINKDSKEMTSFIEQYTCSLCLCILKQPYKCPQDHFICIRNYIRNNEFITHNIIKYICKHHYEFLQEKQCPICREQYPQNPRHLIARNAQNTIEMVFKLKCENWETGCKQEVQCIDKEIIDHSLACQYKLVICKNQGCNKQIVQNNLNEHNEICEFRLIECENCKKYKYEGYDIKTTAYPISEFKNHQKNCNYVPSKCQFCSKDIPKVQINVHTAICDKRMVKCPECKKQMQQSEFVNHNQFKCYKGPGEHLIQFLLERIENQEKSQKNLQKQFEILMEQKIQLINQLNQINTQNLTSVIKKSEIEFLNVEKQLQDPSNQQQLQIQQEQLQRLMPYIHSSESLQISLNNYIGDTKQNEVERKQILKNLYTLFLEGIF